MNARQSGVSGSTHVPTSSSTPAKASRTGWPAWWSQDEGPIGRSNLVAKVVGTKEGKQRVEDILEGQRERVRAVLAENADVHHALRDALIQRDELVRDDILEVVQGTLGARTGSPPGS